MDRYFRRVEWFGFVLLAAYLSFGAACDARNSGRDGPDTRISDSRSDTVSARSTGDLPFGNPSNATADTSNKDNYLIIHDGYVLAYNDSRGTMNWIAWWTRRKDLGDAVPRSLFEPDPSLPDGFRKVRYYDYSGSGYDRGHMVPSADRFGDKRLNEQTFWMTNIVPQAADLNQFPWQKFESYTRTLVYRGSTVYTIAGVYGDRRRIRGRVTAPTNCWKIVVVFPAGRDLGSIDSSTRIIAVDMPNISGIEDVPWQAFRTSVRTIEEKTGDNFFSSLPGDIQDRLETRIDGN